MDDHLDSSVEACASLRRSAQEATSIPGLVPAGRFENLPIPREIVLA